jgi:hypothetical protein
MRLEVWEGLDRLGRRRDPHLKVESWGIRVPAEILGTIYRNATKPRNRCNKGGVLLDIESVSGPWQRFSQPVLLDL